MEEAVAKSAFLGIIIMISSMLFLLISVNWFVQTQKYRAERGYNVTAEENEKSILFFSKIPIWALYVYVFIIIITVIFLLNKKRPEKTEISKFKYK